MVAMRTFILVTALCSAVASPCLAVEEDSKIVGEINALVVQHDKALNAHDLDGVMATYSPAPNIVLMGTGPGEAYVGAEAIAGAYTQFFTRFKANTLNVKYDWILTGAKGDIAWFALTLTMSATTDKGPQERAFNLTGAAEQQSGQWRFVALHFSRLRAEQQTATEAPK